MEPALDDKIPRRRASKSETQIALLAVGSGPKARSIEARPFFHGVDFYTPDDMPTQAAASA